MNGDNQPMTCPQCGEDLSYKGISVPNGKRRRYMRRTCPQCHSQSWPTHETYWKFVFTTMLALIFVTIPVAFLTAPLIKSLLHSTNSIFVAVPFLMMMMYIQREIANRIIHLEPKDESSSSRWW